MFFLFISRFWYQHVHRPYVRWYREIHNLHAWIDKIQYVQISRDNTEDSNRCRVNVNVRVRTITNCSPLSRRHQYPGQKSCPGREQWFKSVTKCKSKRTICSSNLPYYMYLMFFHFQVKSKFQDVFNQVTAHLHLRETEYFGLALKKGKWYYNIEPYKYM